MLALFRDLEKADVARCITEPRLITTSERRAIFQSNCETRAPDGGLGFVTKTYVPVDTTISVLPKILDGRRAYLEIEATFSSVDESKRNWKWHSSFELADGATYGFGGVKYDQVSCREVAVPFLCDLPYVGFLFRKKWYEQEVVERLILATPHIVD